eukprot:s2774_g11.t1
MVVRDHGRVVQEALDVSQRPHGEVTDSQLEHIQRKSLLESIRAQLPVTRWAKAPFKLRLVHCSCMPAESAEEVAADHSATETVTPAGGTEVAAPAEEVDQTDPLPAEPAAEATESWADCSEAIQAPVPTTETPSVEVKEEEIEVEQAQTLGAVLHTIGISEVVADEPVATEVTSSSHLSGQEFLQTAPTEASEETEVPAVAAFADLDQTPSTPSEEVPAEAIESAEIETTNPVGLEESAVAADIVVDASDTLASGPEVAEPIATAPPTTHNLVAPGVEVGHSPSAPSRRPRVRSSRGGQTTRWQEAQREWYNDFDEFRYGLYEHSGGDAYRGFWLRKCNLQEGDRDQRWFIALFPGILDFLGIEETLALAYFLWTPYQEWVWRNCLDRRTGLAHGSAGPPPPAKGPPLPPPQEPPPTREELAARAPQQPAREVVTTNPEPEDPNDPDEPQEEEAGDQEEREEEQPLEEDLEEEAEPRSPQETGEEEAEPGSPREPEFPDFSSLRTRSQKRLHSRQPPVLLRLLTRQQREDLELRQTLDRAAREIRAYPATGVSRRGVVLQPAVPGYPETRIDSTGTWARIAGPLVAISARVGTTQYALPTGEELDYSEVYSLPDAQWRNPQLTRGSIVVTDTLQRQDIISVTVDNPDTESEGVAAAMRDAATTAILHNQEEAEAALAERDRLCQPPYSEESAAEEDDPNDPGCAPSFAGSDLPSLDDVEEPAPVLPPVEDAAERAKDVPFPKEGGIASPSTPKPKARSVYITVDRILKVKDTPGCDACLGRARFHTETRRARFSKLVEEEKEAERAKKTPAADIPSEIEIGDEDAEAHARIFLGEEASDPMPSRLSPDEEALYHSMCGDDPMGVLLLQRLLLVFLVLLFFPKPLTDVLIFVERRRESLPVFGSQPVPACPAASRPRGRDNRRSRKAAKKAQKPNAKPTMFEFACSSDSQMGFTNEQFSQSRDLGSVREKEEVRKEAKASGVSVHFGQLMTIASIKFYELAEHLHKMKGRIVYRGDCAQDEHGAAAVYQELGASPTSVQGLNACLAYGSLPGNRATAADAVKAYVQALLSSKYKTWTELPPELRPKYWKQQFVRPVVLLIKALCGHPDAGGLWEQHLQEIIHKLGGQEDSHQPGECALCLDEYSAGDCVTRLTCFHAFHKSCLDPWLDKSPTCPSCKFDLLSEIHGM